MRLLPNVISLFRILLVPVFIIAYFADERDIKTLAVLVYAVACASDFLDGYFARRLQAISTLGKFLDPLGDKLMTVSVMACITIDGLIPLWAVLVAGCKEILMAIGGFIIYRRTGAQVLPSNILGKTSTVIFFLICAALMLFRGIPGAWATALISFAIVMMFVALASYFKTYVSVMKIPEKAGKS